MFPIRDHNPSNRTPFVTYALIAANVIVFIGYWPLFSDERALSGFFDVWAMVPREISQGRELHTLLTSMFLHGGLMHIGGNMLFLWIFGDNLEDEMGHMGFLGFYLSAGVLAGLAQWLAAPASPVPTVGASGAIAGVMGGYILLFPRARVDVLIIFVIFFKVFPLPAWAMLGFWFGLQVFSGFGADATQGGVAYWAHAGGFLAGLGMTLPLWLRLGGPRFWNRTHGRPPHPEAKYGERTSPIPRVTRRRGRRW
ncbi:rhomboid family intramembrane serine protease [Brevirhabdus pacifica]|uniref:Rhomboid family intramembrane serine protease n=1 Tax=Brevirhabdus pacifica TaxID=1267768 RepID=A0A1U7DG27_9RHOB|nr:rhomboid family intramembrane serine protease [Brevirhabdus pacifica]APX88916.1 rhomboid family intramembrane serine protease [Brevirhabdus pacifica]OWU80145.1 peptidase C54 [Loktanella sp. 22II-4b]PJJ86534.1 membrane associated rhomboid family serine protease [Brevirhabdus pacifica]